LWPSGNSRWIQVIVRASSGHALQVTAFALRLSLTDYVGIPPENEPDPLSEAEAAFAPPQPKSSKPKNTSKSKETPTPVKAPPKKSAAKKQKAA